MMVDIVSLGEKVVAAEAIMDHYTRCIYFLVVSSFGMYKKYIRHKWKVHPMSCNCDPTDVFDQMRTYRKHEPNQCAAKRKCISNALYDLVDTINKATESIDIAMPEFTMPQLLECILSANSRQIDIRIILNSSEGLESSTHMKELLDKGKTLALSVECSRFKFNFCISHFCSIGVEVRFASTPINGALCLIDIESFNGSIIIKSPTWTHAVSYFQLSAMINNTSIRSSELLFISRLFMKWMAKCDWTITSHRNENMKTGSIHCGRNQNCCQRKIGFSGLFRNQNS